ncbi:MAG: type II toxin-antitoxin system prevent-host-death family antitoxin [Nitrospirales bacterium]|nr:type II toxin-antitoxin system prevent-host-death family antitoxin [Nitrospirales bacterium]MBA3964755.1 type II toxin-antitoxin system prevent-host-death family antitoxin [Nitrospirales bacterium]
MKTTPVSELRATLSEQLARVKAGEEVVVTERGRPIAKIVPFSSETMWLSAHMSELARNGLIRLGTGKISKDIWKLPRPIDKRGQALKALLDEREQGR